jgi:hypothetical protein
MRKSPEFLQAEEDPCEGHHELGVSLSQKKDRILRRATLELLPSLAEWSQRKSALTQMAIRETLRRPSLYENAPPSQWRGVLEEFSERSLELLLLEKPLRTKEILTLSVQKNVLTERLKELGSAGSKTLLLVWHQDTGLLAITQPTLPKHFPHILTKTEFHCLQNPYKMWLWDRKNFTPHD